MERSSAKAVLWPRGVEAAQALDVVMPLHNARRIDYSVQQKNNAIVPKTIRFFKNSDKNPCYGLIF
jgi:hypothetical protein